MTKFWQNRLARGCCSQFLNERLQQIRDIKFFFLLKIAEVGGTILGRENHFLIIKSDFAPLNPISRGKYQNRSRVKRRSLLCYISKNRKKAKFLKICILNSLIPVITCSKLQVNQVQS